MIDVEPGTIRPLLRSEFDRLVALGAFEEEPIELLQGVLVRMPPPHGPEHDGTIQILARLLAKGLADRAEVRVQSAFAAGPSSEPEPDIAVVASGDYRDAHPTNAHLIVEVAQTSLATDRGVKAAIYAAASVPEYWIVDLVHGTVEVHTEPSGGRYGRTDVRTREDTLAVRAFTDVTIALRDVLR